MNRNLNNALYGVLDYAAYPVTMLLTSPLTIRFLGPSEYGLWMIAGALISIGGILGSGFSDAGLQRVAAHVAVKDLSGAAHTVQSMLAISLASGSAIAASLFLLAPLAAAHLQAHTVGALESCVSVLRLSALGIFLRCLTSIAISTQRAMQKYRYATLINAALHTTSLVAARVLAAAGFHVGIIVAANVLLMAIALLAQWRHARRLLAPQIIRPRFLGANTRTLLHDGSFLWLQTIAAVASDRFDRILLGITLGAAAVTPYAVCVQISQPLCGVTASALSFLFPYVAEKATIASAGEVRASLAKAVAANVALIAVGLFCTLLLGRVFLARWVGASVGAQASTFLVPVSFGSAFLGLSVTGIFALQAVRWFRALAALFLATRAMSVLAMVLLLTHFGTRGLAASRLFTGVCALLVYIPTWCAFHPHGQSVHSPFSSAATVREGVPS